MAIWFAIAIAVVIQPSNAQTNDQKLTTANNEFAIDIYKKLLNPKENLICSPLSISAVLSMLRGGAVNETNTEIAQSLRLKNMDQTSVDESFESILAQFKSNADYKLSVANGIFIDSSLNVPQEYKEYAKKHYYAEVDTLTGVAQINKFASSKTDGFIEKILDSLPSSTLMVLINAVYFKGSWEKKFNESQNINDTFKNNDATKSTNKIAFMTKYSKFAYYDSLDLKSQVLRIPYEGGNMDMIVFLPKAGSTLTDLENSLTAEKLKSAIDGASKQNVELTFPKFEINSFFNLNEALKSLGMKRAFNVDAQFDKISAKVRVTEVLQKARIEVNEEGTEAAAVTVVIIGPKPTSVTIPDFTSVEFKANHPFMYLLYHKPTSSVLFIGRYTKA